MGILKGEIFGSSEVDASYEAASEFQSSPRTYFFQKKQEDERIAKVGRSSNDAFLDSQASREAYGLQQSLAL